MIDFGGQTKYAVVSSILSFGPARAVVSLVSRAVELAKLFVALPPVKGRVQRKK
jgi:hypothetical protein